MNFEVLRHRAPICSGNGRLKMAEKLSSRKLLLKTNYKGCRKDHLQKKESKN